MAVIAVWKAAIIALGPKSEAIVNTFYYGPDTVNVDTSAQDVADAVDAVIPASLQGLVTHDWKYFKSTVICVHGVNIGKSGESNNNAGMIGSIAGVSGPMNVTAIGKRRGDGVGRHNRGRIFISPILSTMVDVDGHMILPAGYEANIIACATLGITVGAEAYLPCLWDPVHHQAIVVTHASAALECGVQKRRRLRLPN